MLKTMSADERLKSYYLQNPRVCKEFTREDARKIKPGMNTQVGMLPDGASYQGKSRDDG